MEIQSKNFRERACLAGMEKSKEPAQGSMGSSQKILAKKSLARIFEFIEMGKVDIKWITLRPQLLFFLVL